MKNRVTERIPYDWFEIDAIEGWLDEHVRQGLRLVNITPLKRAEFEPATGSLTRYRIHVKEEKDGSRDEEYHETFRELGWEFVAELNDLNMRYYHCNKRIIRFRGLDADKYSAHKLRHTAATLMLQNGVDVRTLQELLGHEHLNTTQIYTHVENENLRDAAERSPLAGFKREEE